MQDTCSKQSQESFVLILSSTGAIIGFDKWLLSLTGAMKSENDEIQFISKASAFLTGIFLPKNSSTPYNEHS